MQSSRKPRSAQLIQAQDSLGGPKRVWTRTICLQKLRNVANHPNFDAFPCGDCAGCARRAVPMARSAPFRCSATQRRIGLASPPPRTEMVLWYIRGAYQHEDLLPTCLCSFSPSPPPHPQRAAPARVLFLSLRSTLPCTHGFSLVRPSPGLHIRPLSLTSHTPGSLPSPAHDL